MELEKIRAADTSVRWQDDDDVEQCPSCKSQFAVTRRKVINMISYIGIKSIINEYFSNIAVIVAPYIVRSV